MDAYFTSKEKSRPLRKIHTPLSAEQSREARAWILNHPWYRKANPHVAKSFVGKIPNGRKPGGLPRKSKGTATRTDNPVILPSAIP
jgi:hypothetical protein